MEELVLVKPRARRVPPKMFLAGIVKKGTENLPNPQFMVYSANPILLKELVDAYNELLTIKKEREKEKVQHK